LNLQEFNDFKILGQSQRQQTYVQRSFLSRMEYDKAHHVFSLNKEWEKWFNSHGHKQHKYVYTGIILAEYQVFKNEMKCQ